MGDAAQVAPLGSVVSHAVARAGDSPVHVSRKGWLESRHREQQLTSTPALATTYRPAAEMTATRWPGGSRHLGQSSPSVRRSPLAPPSSSTADPALRVSPHEPLRKGTNEEDPSAGFRPARRY